MRRFALRSAAAAVLASIACHAPAEEYLPGESVTFDPASGEYVFTYTAIEVDESGEERKVPAVSRYEPETRIEPLMASSFKRVGEHIQYRYRVRNAASAPRAFTGFNVDGLSNLSAGAPVITSRAAAIEARRAGTLDELMRSCNRAVISAANWRGFCASQNSLGVAWYVPDADAAGLLGLQPGATASPFGFDSTDLPGILAAKFSGDSRGWGQTRDPTPGDFDRHEISEALERDIMRIAYEDDIERYVAVPMLASSLDVTALLAALREHVLGWDAALMEADVASNVSASLAAAGSAHQRGDRQAAKKALQDARQSLARKYGDLDAAHPEDDPTGTHSPQEPAAAKAWLAKHDRRLAARVLSFDLKAVEARIR